MNKQGDSDGGNEPLQAQEDQISSEQDEGHFRIRQAQADQESSEQDELRFSIKLSKYGNPLELILTFDNYKQQFKHFIHKYQLAKQQSLALKEIVKARITQKLKKQQKQQNQSLKNQEQNKQKLQQRQESHYSNGYNYRNEHKLPFFDQNKTLNPHKDDYTRSARQKTTNDQAQNSFKDETIKSSNKHSSTKPHKKLFDTQFTTKLKQNQHQFYTLNSPISSIHSQSDSKSQNSYEQKKKVQNNWNNPQNQQQRQTQNSHLYIQPHHNEDLHVSFNHLHLCYQISDDSYGFKEDCQNIPKSLIKANKTSVSQKHSINNTPQGNQQFANYFNLNLHRKNYTDKCTESNQASSLINKLNLVTPQKQKSPHHNPHNQNNYSSPLNTKSHRVKHVPQSTKVQPTHYNKISSISKNTPSKPLSKSITKSLRKPLSKSLSKSPKAIPTKQKQVIHQIFYRLHREQTASSYQRQKKQKSCKTPKQRQDQRVVYESIVSHRKKYQTMGSQQRQQLFTKLYLTSTQSSMNRKNHLKNSNNYSNQIQHIINQSNKHNHFTKCSRSKRLKSPDFTKPVYNFMTKRCNAHCQQHEYEKKLIKQAQIKKQKEQEIKKKVRSRSKEEYSQGKPHSKSKSHSKAKLFGECQCCHKQKIQDQRKVKDVLRKKKHKPSYSSTTKYSLEKKLLPTNISFISDVLEQSYNQLFPNNNTKK